MTHAWVKPLAHTINVALARFRAADDSSDIYFAAELPVKHLVEDVDLASGSTSRPPAAEVPGPHAPRRPAPCHPSLPPRAYR